MKKTLFLLLALLSWQFVPAEVVTENQARQRAADFFTKAEVQTKATPVRPDDFKLVGTFPDVATKSSSSAPVMYIFDRPSGGYAIVSGDDVARPVLGYSLGGHFPVSDMPDNMRAMLQWYTDVIEYARQQHWESAPETEADAGLDPANTVQLETAQWSQGHPFNDLVPEINGQKPPIGCVATAIAIVMQYHKWPHQGSGMLPSYDYTEEGVKYHVDGFELGNEYDWDKMPEDYRNCSEEEAAQIARLLYDVAVMCQMSFYPGGSFASTPISSMRLPEFFGYDKQIRYYKRSSGYSDIQWERFVIDEIIAGRPVLYQGSSYEGHAFVIDGYNDRYFSINYGWGGGSTWRDGHDRNSRYKDFYTLTPIEGHQEDLFVFNAYQYAICHILPDQGGIPEMNLYSYSENALPIDYKLGQSLQLSVGIQNNSFYSGPIEVCFALFDKNGDLREKVSSTSTVDISAFMSRLIELSCQNTLPIQDGDFIAPALPGPQLGTWVPVVSPRKTRIVFTRCPLKEMIELGYLETPQNPDPDRERNFYMKVYKDLCWGLYKDGDSTPLLNNEALAVDSRSGKQISYRAKMLDTEDAMCDTAYYECWLPSGRYLLHLRNPLTNEQMEIHLEL